MAQKSLIDIRAAKALPLGAHAEEGHIHFAIALQKDDMPVVLKIMERDSRHVICEIHMGDYPAAGRVYAVDVSGIDAEDICYQYVGCQGALKDDYAQAMADDPTWGIFKKPEERRIYRVYQPSFDWDGDRHPRVPFEDMILYKLHVRGFTKDKSSGVSEPGTFMGLTQKIPYLKELGINAVELMPVVDFEETVCRGSEETFVNYWGYGDAQYFIPKAAYGKKDVHQELCSMVRAFHAHGIEVILEIYFIAGTNGDFILNCLRHWVLCYHVDGFHVNEEIADMHLLINDPVLADIKLICGSLDAGGIYGQNVPPVRRLGSAGDDFRNMARCFLKGDSHCTGAFLWYFTRNDRFQAPLNYITNHNGFTLADLVSYNEKHNGANGEDNRDGTNFNYSWNCGAEGFTTEPEVCRLRQKQMRNAMVMVLLGQATPVIYAGDEFGNSQRGNNNAYCQDNPMGWLDWNDIERNREFYDFVKMLIRLRREHPVLHGNRSFTMKDELCCGAPDLSFHGVWPWYPDDAPENRYAGIMYCGEYACTDGQSDDWFYFAVNMHWESAVAALPWPTKHRCWKVCVDTADWPKTDEKMVCGGDIIVEPRSIVILQSCTQNRR